MPLLPVQFRSQHAVVIDLATFENPDNKEDSVTLYVCKPSVQLMADQISKDFNGLNLESLSCLLNSYSEEVLKSHVNGNGGTFKLTLDG